MEGFRIEMEQELQTLRFELEDEGKAMLGILKRLQSCHIHMYIFNIFKIQHKITKFYFKILKRQNEYLSVLHILFEVTR